MPSDDEIRPSVASEQRHEPSRGGERRLGTVLFADLVGFTAFSDRRGEEAAYSLMQRTSELMTAAIHAQGGTVKNFTGDGVMALFGVPTALEDAPLRACRAALNIQERIESEAATIEAKFGLRPQMRIGINTGPMIIGEIKSGESTGVTAIGDTVNLAARLLGLAEPGAVVLSEATHRLVRGLVEIKPAGEHEIKGKAEKQKIYRLEAIHHRAARFDRSVSIGLTAYVGRSRELKDLERALEAAAHGIGVVDIVGEPGIGKSRLVYEFRRLIDDQRALVLSGSCAPDGQQTPFLLFIDIVRSSFGVSKGEAESEIARKLDQNLTMLGLASEQNLGLLLNLLGLKAPESALKDMDGLLISLRTRDLLLRLLQERCRLMPVVMVIEDLHWIDNASEEVLGRVIALETELALLIVQTYRSEYRAPWADQPRVRTLRLEPLTTADTSQIVCARFGVGDVPAALSLARVVTDKAEGNPLFAEEIASYLVERELVRLTGNGIEYDAQTVAAALPASIQSLLSARVDQLSEKDRYLLQAASVIGRRFSRDLLAVLTRSDDVDGRLAAIENLDLIHPYGRSEEVAFKHALVRDALYDRLLTAQRQALHLRVAEAIERRSANRLLEVAEVLAYHYGCTSQADKAFQYHSAAGRKSLAIYSLDEAERYCRKALDLIDAHPGCAGEQLVAEVITLLLEVLYLNGNNPAVAREAERYMPRLETMPDSPHLAVALSFYSLTLGNKGDFRAGEAAAKRALDIAERIGDAKAEGYALVGLLFCATVLFRYPLAVAETLGARLLSSSEKARDNYLQNWAYWCIAWDYLLRGLMNQSRDWAAKLVASGHERGDPRALGMAHWTLGFISMVGLSFDDAVANANACIQVAVTPYDRNFGRIVKATAEILQGRVAEGLAQLEELRDWAQVNGFLHVDGVMDFATAVGLVVSGSMREGIQLLQRAIAARDASGDRANAAWCRGTLAEIYLEILLGERKVPLRMILKNLDTILAARLFGARRVRALLEQVAQQDHFSERGTIRARINMELGLLYKVERNPDRARKHLEQALAVAQSERATGMVDKITTELLTMTSVRATL